MSLYACYTTSQSIGEILVSNSSGSSAIQELKDQFYHSMNDICIALGDELTRCLPALHALTGCDTTSKISTKLAALKAVCKPGNSYLILNFGNPQLTERAIQMAETFLVKCIQPSTDLATFDDLRLAAFNSNALKMDFEKTTCT